MKRNLEKQKKAKKSKEKLKEAPIENRLDKYQFTVSMVYQTAGVITPLKRLKKSLKLSVCSLYLIPLWSCYKNGPNTFTSS